MTTPRWRRPAAHWVWFLLCALVVLSCNRASTPAPPSVGELVRTGGGPHMTGPAVRYRPGEATTTAEVELLTRLPQATVDRGLHTAASELLALATGRRAALDPGTTGLVTARAGFPGQARYARELNMGAFPTDLVSQVREDGPVDVALVQRTWDDGSVLWVLGWAPHVIEMDPLPRDLPLDGVLPLRVDPPAALADADLLLLLAPPDGPVYEVALSGGVARFIDRFHVPGPYRVEVVTDRGGIRQVVLLFTLYVAEPPPAPTALRPAPERPADPVAAEAWLYDALGALRSAHGLPPLTAFPTFTGLAREHSALMASEGRVAHLLPGVTDGVEARAAQSFHPRATHQQDVAAALTAADAFALVTDSPGHLNALLCTDCTHVVIGCALEPVLDRVPRLFVTWELLSFPSGEPRVIPRYER
jgi:uncharacterized protein YkwD